MLSLLVNNQSLDLSADVSITLKFSSPIFNTIGDYTYPFKIPATSKNIAALGFVHRVENFGNVNKSYDAILLSDGITILKGSLRILKAQADFYEASFYMDKGDFSFKRQKATLQDFDFGTMTFASEGAKLVYMNNCKNTVYPARNFSFPMIQNLSYLETYPEPPDRALANINDYWYGIMSNVSIDGNRNIHTPMLYLKYVIKTIFDSMDYTYENTFFDSDSVFNSLVLYNSVDCNGLATGYFNYSNLKLLLSYHVPVISLNDFLSGLENFFNIRFFVNNITGTIKVLSVDDIVKSTSSTEYSKNVSAIYVDNSEKPSGFHLSMNMDTDDTYWANIKSAQETNLEHIKDSVDSYSDLKPWPQSKSLDCKWVRDEQKFYVLWNYVWTVFPWSTQDLQFYSDYFYKGKDLAISTKFSTLMTGSDSVKAVVGAAQSAWADCTPKLFFTKLFTETSQANLTSQIGCNSLNGHFLFYQNSEGIFNKYYRAYCDFRDSAKLVSIVKQMLFLEIANLDFSSKYRINDSNYLLSEVQVCITNHSIKPATIKAYSIL